MHGDVVLVHGLLSSEATWDPLTSALGQVPELDGLRLQTYGYPSEPFRLPFSTRRIPGYREIAQALDEHLLSTRDPGSPLALVGHSQGGLIIQTYLSLLLEDGRAEELTALRLVVLLACPTDGSQYLATLRRVLRLNRHAQIGHLAPGHEVVENVHRNVVRGVVNARRNDSHQWRVPFYVYAGLSDNIVTFRSSEARFPKASTLPGDHFSILRPDAKRNITLPTLTRLLREYMPDGDTPARAETDSAATAGTPAVLRLKVIRQPPDLVPAQVRDRHDTRAAVLRRLGDGTHRVTVLAGPGGAGRTALLCDLFNMLRTGQGPAVDACSYLSARGHLPVNPATVLADLASAVPQGSAASQLVEFLDDPGLNWLCKLQTVLRELDGLRVLLVVDDGEMLMEPDGRFADRGFEDLLHALSQEPGHRVQVLLATSLVPASQQAGLRRGDLVDFTQRLPYDNAVELLRDFGAGAAPDACGGATQDQLRQVYSLTAGLPRALELFHGAVAGSSLDRTLTSLHLCGQSSPDDLRLRLLDESVACLPEREREALHAVAALGRPSPLDAVEQVLGRPAGPDLERLVALRVVRRWEGRFYLPAVEADHLLDGLDVGRASDRFLQPPAATRAALLLRAADYYAEQVRRHPARQMADLGPHVAEVELRVKAGQYGEAFEIMTRLDEEHLQSAGHSDVLSGYRLRLLGRLPTPHDEVRVLLQVANAKSQQEQYDEALAALARAQATNDEVRSTRTSSRNAVVLLIAGAGVRFDAGRASQALQDYDTALTRLDDPDDALQRAQALAGGGLCLLEVGRLPAAEERLRQAKGCLARTSPRDGGKDRFSLELDHNLALVRAYRGDHVEALRLLRVCRQEAQERGYPLLAARSLDAMVVAHLIEGDYREARERARAASAEAAQLGYREFTRAAFGSLALTELLLDHPEEARTAAHAALGFGHDRRSWSHWVLRGIALLQMGMVEGAYADFSSACRRADEVLRSEPDDYQVHEHHALALSGLVLCGESETRPEALATFGRARDLTRDEGVLRLCQLRLSALLRGQDPGRWDDLRRAAAG